MSALCWRLAAVWFATGASFPQRRGSTPHRNGGRTPGARVARQSKRTNPSSLRQSASTNYQVNACAEPRRLSPCARCVTHTARSRLRTLVSATRRGLSLQSLYVPSRDSDFEAAVITSQKFRILEIHTELAEELQAAGF